jgi:DNA-binding YbaB/EbfC family protein
MSAGGSFGEMGNLLKQAQEMTRQLDRAREELRTAIVNGSAGGGLVRVDATGEGLILRVAIKPELVAAGDVARLEELVLAAAREAITKAHALRDERLSKVTGGLNLPGLF